MRLIKRTGLIGLMLLACSVMTVPVVIGCKSQKLEPGGAYAPATTNADGTLTFSQAPDMDLFVADSAFELGYTAMETAFKVERDNRALLWKASPQIKHALDSIRPQAVEAKRRYAIARAAYLANPIPANLDVVNTVLANVRALSAAASAAVQAK